MICQEGTLVMTLLLATEVLGTEVPVLVALALRVLSVMVLGTMEGEGEAISEEEAVLLVLEGEEALVIHLVYLYIILLIKVMATLL